MKYYSDCIRKSIDQRSINMADLYDINTCRAFLKTVENIFDSTENIDVVTSFQSAVSMFPNFERYHQLILEDMLTIILRLSAKKGHAIRNYQVDIENKIKIFSAFLLHLTHNMAKSLDFELDNNTSSNVNLFKNSGDNSFTALYNKIWEKVNNFLSSFFKKCHDDDEQTVFKPLFMNFIQDLLDTLQKPEWPASELLLDVLCKLFVKNFTDTSNEIQLRAFSLDCLGLIAAHFRKKVLVAQSTKYKQIINSIVLRFKGKMSLNNNSSKSIEETSNTEKILRNVLIRYLDITNTQTLQFSRKFYILKWYRNDEYKKSLINKKLETNESTSNKEQSRMVTRLKAKLLRENLKKTMEENKVDNAENIEGINTEMVIIPKRSLFTTSRFNLNSTVNSMEAEFISIFLSFQNTSRSFDSYLSWILQAIVDNLKNIRAKGVKCLTSIIDIDPSIFEKSNVKFLIHSRFLDCSSVVRDAMIVLVGKYLLVNPNSNKNFYDMILDRISDTFISVRKKAIIVLKAIYLKHPTIAEAPIICREIISHINDESIRSLVEDVFENIWFSPILEANSDEKFQVMKNISKTFKGYAELTHFEQLFCNLLNCEHKNQLVTKASQCIVDYLLENAIDIQIYNSDTSVGDNWTTLWFFAKVYPLLFDSHVCIIHQYFNGNCIADINCNILINLIQILEFITPCCKDKVQTIFAETEENLLVLIFKENSVILQKHCVSCLSVITSNYQLIKNCFEKIMISLTNLQGKCLEGNFDLISKKQLFINLNAIGLFCRYFDLQTVNDKEYKSLKVSIFQKIMCFYNHKNEKVKLRALISLGHMTIRYHELMLDPEIQALYEYLLTFTLHTELKCQVLKNLLKFIVVDGNTTDETNSMQFKYSKNESYNVKSYSDSCVASSIIQKYLTQISHAIFDNALIIRKTVLEVIQIILNFGLINPIHIVPCLVCLSSEDDEGIRVKANYLLQEIRLKYSSFILMKAMLGVRKSFEFQQFIQNKTLIIRGFFQTEDIYSRNGVLYSIIRTIKQDSRALLFNLIKLFDEHMKTPLTELLYISDNIVYFPYKIQDEPLYVIYQIDIILALMGWNLLQTFHDALLPHTANCSKTSIANYDEKDEDGETVLSRLPDDISMLKDCIMLSQNCILLLFIRKTLKDMYNLKENTIEDYSPNKDEKLYEITLKNEKHVDFNPSTVIKFIQSNICENQKINRKQVVEEFLNFKKLMINTNSKNKSLTFNSPVKSNMPLENKNYDNIPIDIQSVKEKTIPVVFNDTPIYKNLRPRKTFSIIQEGSIKKSKLITS